MDNQLNRKVFQNGLKDNEELLELRSLLLDIEPERVNKLYDSLDNLELQAEDVSKVLPEAVVLSSQEEEHLSSAMVSTVEKAIHESVSSDLNILTEAIFPIIGPAIRKAVATAFDEMLQSMNQTLEHSLSPQSFKWRLEARRTGKSFAEIVILRTLIYRVEQVFLIHRENGLLLHHIVAPQVSTQDPDLVSAMLCAIQDFVHDSFKTDNQDILQSVDFGDLNIWIERGPFAVLAAIIRGNAPQELRLVLQDNVEKIHLKFDQQLQDFRGDTRDFEDSKPYLEACLESRYKPRKEKNYTFAWIILAVLAIAVSTVGFFAIRENIRWRNFVAKLDAEPGVKVVDSGKRNNKYFISGMRDPLAANLERLIEQSSFTPQQIEWVWESYTSHEPRFLLQRAKRILQPPETVSVNLEEDGFLIVSGSAPRKWIVSARDSWRFIPGVVNLRENNLVEIEVSQLENYKQQIEKTTIFFTEKTTDIIPQQDKKLKDLAINFQKIIDTSKYIDRKVSIEIIGHTSAKGTKEFNQILSQQRADKIINYLGSKNIDITNVKAKGVASNQLLKRKGKNNNQNQDHAVDTRVTFQVFLDKE